MHPRYNDTLSSLIRFIFIAGFSLLLAGCLTSPPQPEMKKYNLSIGATSNANNSAPLKVRVLLLRSDAEFMSADFYSLQNSTQETLRTNLINSEEFFLTPQQLTKHLPDQTYSDARYIGVIAEYQNLNGKKWRISLPLSAQSEGKEFYKFWKWFDDEKQAHIFIDENGINILNEDLRR